MLNPKYLLLIFIISLSSCKEIYTEKENKKNTKSNYNKKSEFESIEKDSLQVIGISDGDSFKVLFQNQELKIRIHGIDAPERNMLFYKTSKNFLSELIFRKHVYVKILKKDQYYRYIADVFLTNEKNIAYEMVKNGMAWHFTKYSDDENLENYQEIVIDNKIGIWSEENPIPPWEFRKMK